MKIPVFTATMSQTMFGFCETIMPSRSRTIQNMKKTVMSRLK